MLLHYIVSCQHVQDEDGGPAHDKYHYYQNQHFDYLKQIEQVFKMQSVLNV